MNLNFDSSVNTYPLLLSPVDIDEDVHEAEEEEGHASCGHHEAHGPEVLVDGDDPSILGEPAERPRYQAAEYGPDQPPRDPILPVLVNQEHLVYWRE